MEEFMLIDTKEPSNIERFLKKAMVLTKRSKLEYGDYCIGNIGIERKTVQDFYNAIVDRKNPDRLRLQLKGFSESYDKKALILEGLFPARISTYDYLRYTKIWNYLLSLVFGWNIPVIRTIDDKETAFVLECLYGRVKDKKPFIRKIKRRGLSLEERKSDILCCIPGLGRRRAELLLSKKPTIWNIITTPKEELYKIKGIGKEVIDNLFKHIYE